MPDAFLHQETTSFREFRDTLKPVFADHLELDTQKEKMNFISLIRNAEIKIQAYLDRHRLPRLTGAGRNRVEWAKELRSGLAKIAGRNP